MNKPTEAQWKEFLEWCGFRYGETTKQVCGVVTKCFMWKYPDGSWHEYLPPIDPNNLFRYAVPTAITCLDIEETLNEQAKRAEGFKRIFALWAEKIYEIDNLTLALFWALWQVKESIGNQKY